MVPIFRKPLRVFPNPARVIARAYLPGGPERVRPVAEHVRNLAPAEVQSLLKQLLSRYSGRHRNITRLLSDNCEKALADGAPELRGDALSEEQRLLLGAYFTMEYSIESTAFFNPSIVEAPDQRGASADEKKVILSFRAVGEGHISSIAFREGTIDGGANLRFLPDRNSIVDTPQTIVRHIYNKDQFIQKMREIGLPGPLISLVREGLKPEFLYGELLDFLDKTASHIGLHASIRSSLPQVKWLAHAHYEIAFSPDTPISERVIFPVSYREKNGIEDVRLVRFTDTPGHPVYYGTYTAYNGISVLPKILETEDFYRFKMSPLHGPHVKNKGLALFPRRIHGKYAMLARIDGINNYIMFSDDIHFWPEEAVLFQSPEYPWEYIQLGNCGSPMETEKGWLLLTHGVGAMREYCIGAVLLDREDPTRVLGRLKEPLLMPNEEEREGYVPNVVYSCGAIIHGGDLMIPYGVSDYSSTYASVPLKDLLRTLCP
jgi:predicted GH43/DUF377 family glycosyl hydrolase